MSCLSHNHDSSALMKWPNSNQFANCSDSVNNAHLVCLCKHVTIVSKTKELDLAGKVESSNKRVKSQRNVATSSQSGWVGGRRMVDYDWEIHVMYTCKKKNTVLISVHCSSGTCLHEHISPLLGEHPHTAGNFCWVPWLLTIERFHCSLFSSCRVTGPSTTSWLGGLQPCMVAQQRKN